MTIWVLKASPSRTLPALVAIKGHTRADGHVVQSHVAIRHHKVAAMPAPPPAPSAPADRLNAFIQRHGGPAGIRNEIATMTPTQRAKITEALAGLGGVSVAEVASRLDIQPWDLAADQPMLPLEDAQPPAEAAPDPPPEPAAAELSSNVPVETDAYQHDVDDAEDREDLAAAMVENPHSDNAKGILRRIADRIAHRMSKSPP